MPVSKRGRTALLVPLGLFLGLCLLLAGCEDPRGDSEEREARIEAAAYPEGAALYERQCRACHQSDGSGISGQFPPLAQHVPRMAQVEGGREYLIDVILYGIGGEIEVLGNSYSGVMPGFRRLSDRDVAQILNHSLHAWGGEDLLPEDFDPYEADEVAERRDQRPSPHQVREQRPLLD